jgi:glutamate formiminotransferase / 5-formyltetrahydrofolate cyclo-ligase
MAKIIECVPNFSEGRDLEKVERIVAPFKNQTGFKMISYEPDGDYNRTVVTLIGEAGSIMEALMPFVAIALKEIDMNKQRGEHPRIGAVDVIPFIPIQDVTLEECSEFANIMAKRISDTFDIPVFMYAKSARNEERISLPNIRKGEYEGMITKIKEPEWHPDYGRPESHPTFGSVAIGARPILVAYNIDLDTDNEKIANHIAKAIRQSSGGFQHIQAGPAFLEEKHHMQVTMNILDYTKNPMYRIYEVVKMEALRFHVAVKSAEIIGLIPKAALSDSIKYYLQVESKAFDKNMDLKTLTELSIGYLKLRDFNAEKIIESWM